MSCAFDGNNDLYGIGIRIGVYLSLASTIYAKYHLPDALSGALVTNAIFIFALLIAVIQNVVNDELRAVEGYIMLQVIFGFVLSSAESGSVSLTMAATAVSALSKEDFELAMSQFSRTQIAEHALGLLRIACATINAWFWFRGINHLDDIAGCPGFQIFFFAQYSSEGNIRKLFRAMATLYLLQQFIRQVFMVHNTYLTYLKSPHHNVTQPSFNNRLWSMATFLTTTTDQAQVFVYQKAMWTNAFSIEYYTSPAVITRVKASLRYFRQLLLIRDSIMLAWTILTVELGLKWNRISQVNMVSSTGQLIPLVIGITSVIPSFSELIQKILKKKQAKIANQMVKIDADRGQWQYSMRNGKTVAFQHRLNVRRRWSIDHSMLNRTGPPTFYSSQEQTRNKTSTVAEIQSKSSSKFSIIGGFTPTKYKSELRGPPLYPTERGWRLYVPLSDGTLQAFNGWIPVRRNSCPHIRNLDKWKQDVNIAKKLIEWPLDNTVPRIFSSRGIETTEESDPIEWMDFDPTKTMIEALHEFTPQILTTKLDWSMDFTFMNAPFWMVKVKLEDWRNGLRRIGIGDNVQIPRELRSKILFYLDRDQYDEEDLEFEPPKDKREKGRPQRVRSSSMNDINNVRADYLITKQPRVSHIPLSTSESSDSTTRKANNDTSTNKSPAPCWEQWRIVAFHFLTVFLSLINLFSFIIFLPLFGPWLTTYMQRNIIWMIRPSKRPMYEHQDTCMVTVMPAITAAFWYLPRCIAHWLLRPNIKDNLPNGMFAQTLYDWLPAIPSVLTIYVFGIPLFLYMVRKPVYDDVLYLGKEEKEDKDKELKSSSITTKIAFWIEQAYLSKRGRQIKYILWPISVPLLITGKCWSQAFNDFDVDLKENAQLRDNTYLRILAWMGYLLAWMMLPVTLFVFGVWYVVYHFLYIRKRKRLATLTTTITHGLYGVDKVKV